MNNNTLRAKAHRSRTRTRGDRMQFFVYFTMEEGQQVRQSAPTPEEMAEIGKFHEEAIQSGVIVATGRLSQTTTRIRKEGDEVSVTDGPFIEGKELIPGFTVIRTDTREEAIDWVTRYREMMGMPELRIAEVLG
jgi:hypothetical protein